MRVLVVDSDPQQRHDYREWFKTFRNVQLVALNQVTDECDASAYDVVIIDKEEAKYFISNTPPNHMIVASRSPSSQHNGTWAITKPFHMQELTEILQVITTGEVLHDTRCH